MVDIKREGGAQKRKRVFIRTAAAAVILAGVSVSLCHLKPASPKLSRAAAWIDSVKRGSMSVQIRGAGTLMPKEVRWIPAGSDGRVERVPALAGTSVSADTVVVEISNPELQQERQEAELQLRAAEAELRNRRLYLRGQILSQHAVTAAVRADYEEAQSRAAADSDLAAAGLTSQLALKASRGREKQLGVRLDVEEQRLGIARESEIADLSAAQSRVDQLRALVGLKRQQVEGLRVRAGREGVLQQVVVEVGQRVTVGANLARVAAPYPLKAAIQISQVEASQISIGQPVEIDTHTGVVQGTVARIDPSVQNGSVTIDVRLPLELPRGARPDLSVDALIAIDRIENALFVGRPVQAEANGSVALFRISEDGNTAIRTKVRTGRASFNAIEILDGLEEGDRVILSDTAAFDGHDQLSITD